MKTRSELQDSLFSDNELNEVMTELSSQSSKLLRESESTSEELTESVIPALLTDELSCSGKVLSDTESSRLLLTLTSRDTTLTHAHGARRCGSTWR
jgi:hypothetical protein